MVFALSPDSRATFTKLTPRSCASDVFALAEFFSGLAPALSQRGVAKPRMLSSERTRLDRLRDFRNTRREEENRLPPARPRPVLEFAPNSYIQGTQTLQVPTSVHIVVVWPSRRAIVHPDLWIHKKISPGDYDEYVYGYRHPFWLALDIQRMRITI